MPHPRSYLNVPPWSDLECVPGRAVHYCRLRAVDIWLRAVDTLEAGAH